MTDEFASTIGTEAAHTEVAQAVAATTKLSHQFAVVSDTTMPSTVMTDDCYGRIQTRIKEELGRQSVSSLWIGAFFAFLSVCASAYLAYRIARKSNQPSGGDPYNSLGNRGSDGSNFGGMRPCIFVDA